MGEFGNMKYKDLTYKMKKLGYEFYRQGKGSHELWINPTTKKVIPLSKHGGKDPLLEHYMQ